MFSDTHCHLGTVASRGENLADLLSSMTSSGFRFVLDIGTRPGDFAGRLSQLTEASGGALPEFLHFSCGLWPDPASIANREDSLSALKSDLLEMLSRRPAYAALGECGLDRYWNGANAPGLESHAGEDGPGTADIAGEEELFGAQLVMAREFGLPAIIHSRDAFEPTLACVRDAGWDSGVIHCFSYGKDEARAFLDRGWYISFPGNVTWAKKEADRERIASLVRYVPRDRLLLETDAPYLTPAPHRGATNTPLLIAHTYERVASILGLDVGALAAIVEANASELFRTSYSA
ncbi:MAG TPA: TatD family hydrolase [Treponemataceae bacterium]|nr:TatD family hydrolase [Treponemataceae bacterium]